MIMGKPVTTARVDAVVPDSVAAKAGFQVGDIVTAINGSAIGGFPTCSALSDAAARPDLRIERGGAQVELRAIPALKEMKDNFGNVHRIGVLGISRSAKAEDVKVGAVKPAGGALDGGQGNLVRGGADCSYLSSAWLPGGRPPTDWAGR